MHTFFHKQLCPKNISLNRCSIKDLTTSIHGLSMIKMECFERCPINKTRSRKTIKSKLFFLQLSLDSVWLSLNQCFHFILVREPWNVNKAPFTKSLSSSSSTGFSKSIEHIALQLQMPSMKCLMRNKLSTTEVDFFQGIHFKPPSNFLLQNNQAGKTKAKHNNKCHTISHEEYFSCLPPNFSPEIMNGP